MVCLLIITVVKHIVVLISMQLFIKYDREK
ncbi:hypothetical protein BTT_61760 (plasmid) [Bacillus thuringiensis serovar morrisoni str. 4AA1]|nr:hypothetical protein BTT_61760 [Bacillus thuringiensis serovar morrisoni str. 4AA1]